MRRELTGWAQRQACSQRLSAASRVKSFRTFCESRTAKGCNEARDTQGTTPKAFRVELKLRAGKMLLLDIRADQTSGTSVRHKSACPTIARIKELLVTPKHLQLCAGRFRPTKFIVDVPFPRRRSAGHEIPIKWGWPIENAVTRAMET